MEGDHHRVARQHELFVKELTSLGYMPALPDLLDRGERGDIVAVGFTVTAAFIQTPGPSAGQPLAR